MADIPFHYTSTTRSRVICNHGPCRLGGVFVVNEGTSAVTISVCDSGVSKNTAGIGGTTTVIPLHPIHPSSAGWRDAVWNFTAPGPAGICMHHGIFIHFGGGKISGVTAVVIWN